MSLVIVDAHQDIAYNALTWGRDYRLHPLQHRTAEAHKGALYPRAMLGLPDALLGRVAIVGASIFTAPDTGQPSPAPYARPVYRDAKGAYQQALRQMDYYQRLADDDGRVRILRERADLTAVLDSWGEGKRHQQGLFITFEGADPILEPKQFEEWYERGVRGVGLAWHGTRYSGGTGAPYGLTKDGYLLLDILNSFRVVVDLAHASEKAFYETLDVYQGAVWVSHAVPRRFCNTDRHLTDAMLRRLAERGGVMGVMLLNSALTNRWTKGDPKEKVPLSAVADVIDHVCQVTGSASHVGIGSDFDGGFGAESTPDGVSTVGDLLAIAPLLQARGYADADIQGIMGANFLSVIQTVF